MATVAQTENLMKKQELQPITTAGWRGGLGNMLSKELGQWWGTKMWWIQLIIWVLLMNGITAIVMLEASQSGDRTPIELAQDALQTFLQVGAGVIGIGVIITMQGAIVGEKQSGTAAWVLSKPASRSAFLIAKVIAYAFGFAITAIAIPTILFILQTKWLVPITFSMGFFLAGVVLIALIVMFYLMLTLMLGTLFENRGPIIGIGIAIVLAGMFFKNMLPPLVLNVTPWLVGDISGGIAMGITLPDNWFVPVIATTVWILVFTAVALWRFSREEF